MLYTFPEAFNHEGDSIGNPVRAGITNLPVSTERFAEHEGRLRILVVGGSLGADALNKAVPQASALLPDDARP